ncbi:hypothetical protein Tco_1008643, partial [Tanacetum coccineum]
SVESLDPFDRHSDFGAVDDSLDLLCAKIRVSQSIGDLNTAAELGFSDILILVKALSASDSSLGGDFSDSPYTKTF